MGERKKLRKNAKKGEEEGMDEGVLGEQGGGERGGSSHGPMPKSREHRWRSGSGCGTRGRHTRLRKSISRQLGTSLLPLPPSHPLFLPAFPTTKPGPSAEPTGTGHLSHLVGWMADPPPPPPPSEPAAGQMVRPHATIASTAETRPGQLLHCKRVVLSHSAENCVLL